MPTVKRIDNDLATLNTQVEVGRTADDLAIQIDALEHRAARTGSPCLAAQVLALRDPRVQQLLLDRLNQQLAFAGMRCIRPSWVLFSLYNSPGTISLRSPSFVVVVDLARESVTQLLDHYEAGWSPSEFSASTIAVVGGPIVEEVTMTLTGDFQHGEIAVDNVTIPLSRNMGSAMVTLVPPSVGVSLLLWAPTAASYRFSLTIRGKTVSDGGTFDGGKATPSFTYPFAEFGLPS